MVSKPQQAIWHGPGLQRGEVDVYDFYQLQELAEVVTNGGVIKMFVTANSSDEIKVYQL